MVPMFLGLPAEACAHGKSDPPFPKPLTDRTTEPVISEERSFRDAIILQTPIHSQSTYLLKVHQHTHAI